jgi:hypothetical protein
VLLLVTNLSPVRKLVGTLLGTLLVTNLSPAMSPATLLSQSKCAGANKALVDREREIGDITGKLLEPRPDSLQTKLRKIRALVESRMNDIRGMLNSDPARVRAAFAKHIEKITMEPSEEHYVASGTWHLVGRGSIDGAGGQNRTGYARLFRAALYQ